MRVKTFFRMLRIIAAVTLFFFSWSFGPIYAAVAYAAEGTQRAESKAQSADPSQSPLAKGGSRGVVKTSGERFKKALEAIRENVARAGEKADKGEDNTKELATIKAKRAEIESADIEFKKEFAATDKKLKDAKLPQEIIDRHAKFVKHYEDNLRELKTNLDDVEKLNVDSRQLRAALTKAKSHLEKTKAPTRHKLFNPNSLPSRTREIKPIRFSWFDKAMDWLIPSADAAELPPSSADLAETLETLQTQEIRDLAQRLGSTSVSLYEYVRNAYNYEPYAGSTKGAIQTLREKSGNEWDQASLLIALYRASGIPARYVLGTVEIPIDKAMSWLGVEDPRMAGTLLSTLGRSTSLVIAGGKITAIRTQQVWVRAYVPFLFSRGATSGPGDTWVDIDPSFKSQTVAKTLSVTGAPTFDQSAYLSSFRADSPFDFYKSQLQTFLNTNNPGYVPESLAWGYEITPERFGVLIGQLPYIIKSVITTYSEIPDTYRQKFTLSISDPSTGENLLSYTAPMPQVIGKRMTLSYIPATNADESTIASYGGIYPTPPYLVKLKPEIKIDGVSTVQGKAIGSGQEQSMEFVFDTTIDQGRVENTIIAGGYYAIGLSARFGDTRENILERTNQLAALAGPIDFNDPATLDQKLGEILYLSATVYHQNLDTITKKIASLNHVVDVRDISEMMYFLTLKVDSVFGMPRKITPDGITGDMDRNLHTVAPVDGDMSHIKPFMQLMGNVSSFLEHDVTEKIYQTQALSAVKGIQLAHDQGIPVHTVNSQNVSTALSALQLSSDLESDIANAVNAGQEVIVPERNMTFGSWSGIGYIVQDPINGKAAYLISGGYGGCATASSYAVQDLAEATMVDVAAQTNNATHRIQICYPGEDNLMHTGDDVCYGIYSFGELKDPGCGESDPECRGKYYYPHDDFAQHLIRVDENGTGIHLTKYIKAADWQSQDKAPYMRTGVTILYVIEELLNIHHCSNPNISSKGSAYRTYTRNLAIGGSQTSHHSDGVAADIILTDPIAPYTDVPKKCEVLDDAYFISGGFSEILSEGKPNSVHMASPGRVHTDAAKYPWGCN